MIIVRIAMTQKERVKKYNQNRKNRPHVKCEYCGELLSKDLLKNYGLASVEHGFKP